MEAMAIRGELTYVNTDRGTVHIVDKADNETAFAGITPDTQLPRSTTWRDLIGQDVDVIIVDGKVSEIYIALEE